MKIATLHGLIMFEGVAINIKTLIIIIMNHYCSEIFTIDNILTIESTFDYQLKLFFFIENALNDKWTCFL